MSKRQTDPIIDEIRAVRDAHAARFNYDIDAIFRDIQTMEKTSAREFVRLRPRRGPLPEAEPTNPPRGRSAGGATGSVA